MRLRIPDVDFELITFVEHPIALAVISREAVYDDLLIAPAGHVQPNAIVLRRVFVSGAPASGGYPLFEGIRSHRCTAAFCQSRFRK